MMHLAVIADGNRRWAAKNNLPHSFGHAQGLVCIERICEWALASKVSYLTFYVFSTENWRREKNEINNIFGLARDYFISASPWYIARNIKVQFSGRRDRLPTDIVDSMRSLEKVTVAGTNLTLTICADYGGRDEIVRAIQAGAKTEEEITSFVCAMAPEPDVILRTGGRTRLSNFLIWQSAYSELYFTTTLFPDLDVSELDDIMQRYNETQQNFGR